MPRFLVFSVAMLASVALGAACAGDRATAPMASAASRTSAAVGVAPQGWARRDGRPEAGPPHLVACARRPVAARSMVIGPRGGVLEFGGNLLVVPAGALDDEVTISARVVSDAPTLLVHFEPSGLHFRHPASLVLNAEGCSIPSDAVPDVVYIEHERVLERIRAVFNRAWKSVTAPIEHFSGYSIAL